MGRGNKEGSVYGVPGGDEVRYEGEKGTICMRGNQKSTRRMSPGQRRENKL